MVILEEEFFSPGGPMKLLIPEWLATREGLSVSMTRSWWSTAGSNRLTESCLQNRCSFATELTCQAPSRLIIYWSS